MLLRLGKLIDRVSIIDELTSPRLQKTGILRGNLPRNPEQSRDYYPQHCKTYQSQHRPPLFSQPDRGYQEQEVSNLTKITSVSIILKPSTKLSDK
jgi:hypothetical protein